MNREQIEAGIRATLDARGDRPPEPITRKAVEEYLPKFRADLERLGIHWDIDRQVDEDERAERAKSEQWHDRGRRSGALA